MDDISNKMAKGAVWMVSAKIVERFIGLINTLILARLLNPDDFGLLSMGMAFLGLLTLLTSFSFDIALIQKQDAGRSLYDTAWTFNVIFGALLAVLLWGGAVPLAKFYNEARLVDVVYILAINCFLGGFANIGPVAFRKDLEFNKEFKFIFIKRMFGFVICVGLALWYRNYWALIWSMLIGKAFEVVLSYWIHPYRPKFNLSGRKELFGFSTWMFINNILFFTFHRSADFIISKLLGIHALGVYTVSYELSNLPTTELVAPINRAIMPGYSKMAKDLRALRQGFLNVLSIIALCALPAGVGISLVAEPMVEVILGDKWKDAIPLIQALAVSGIFVALQSNTGSLYMALGKPRIITIISLCHVVFLFLPLLIILLQTYGSIGVAGAYLISNFIILPINYMVVSKMVKISFRALFAVLWRPFFACGFLVVTVMYAKRLLVFYNVIDPLIILSVEVFFGVIIYSCFTVMLWKISGSPDGAESYLLRKIFK